MPNNRTRQLIGLVALFTMIMGSLALPMTIVASTAGKDYCASNNPATVEMVFGKYRDEHGGLAINGYALTKVQCEELEDGNKYLVQWFERVRMEYHPENAGTQYEVLLGQFGRRIVLANGGKIEISEVDWRFHDYYFANGGLPQFGYAIGNPYRAQLEDGKEYIVQWFERARFEYHPENAAPYDILLGRFGAIVLAMNSQPQPSASPSPAPVTDKSDPRCPKSPQEAANLLSGGKGTWRDLGTAPDRPWRKWSFSSTEPVKLTWPKWGSFDHHSKGNGYRGDIEGAMDGTFNCEPPPQ